jgi:hypothetical protein
VHCAIRISLFSLFQMKFEIKTKENNNFFLVFYVLKNIHYIFYKFIVLKVNDPFNRSLLPLFFFSSHHLHVLIVSQSCSIFTPPTSQLWFKCNLP